MHLRNYIIFIILLGFLNGSASAQDNSTNVYNPSVSRLGLQLGSGVLLGAAGGVVGGFGGALVAPTREGPAGLITLGYVFTGAYIGYSAASAIGIYIAANSNTHTASLKNIFLGHGIGAAAGIGSIVFMDAVDGPMAPAIILALTAPLAGGIIANGKTIKKRNGSTSALLNISDKKAKLSIPSVQLTKVGNHISKDRSTTVKLLNISL